VDAQAIFLEQASKPKKTDVETKPVLVKAVTKATETKHRDEKVGQPA
jgi:hypothetical protein